MIYKIQKIIHITAHVFLSLARSLSLSLPPSLSFSLVPLASPSLASSLPSLKLEQPWAGSVSIGRTWSFKIANARQSLYTRVPYNAREATNRGPGVQAMAQRITRECPGTWEASSAPGSTRTKTELRPDLKLGWHARNLNVCQNMHNLDSQ